MPHGPAPCVVRHYSGGAQKVGHRLTVAAARYIKLAKRRNAARSEAETAICGPQIAASGGTEGGPRAKPKPGSVSLAGRRPSVWDAGCPAPLATDTRGLG